MSTPYRTVRALGLSLLATTLIACGPANQASNQVQEPPIAIAIHGGAGTILKENMTPEKEQEYHAALAQAIDAGYRILEQGGDSIDAVQAAIRVMEDNPLFNAGKGAVYTYEGRHELDASIMEGKTRKAGAVAGVTTTKSPITAARAVMEQSNHVMLSGQGADDFARQLGLEQVSNAYFNTSERYEQLQQALKAIDQRERGDYVAYQDNWDSAFNMGTVGAVALDSQGNLAAGTSTGGMTAKRWGRIGDSPIIGAGTWADNDSCAVSATGHGEYFIRYQVAADICSRVKYKYRSVEKASHEVIFDVLLPNQGTGGVVVLDKKGNVAMPFNTEGMYRGFKTNKQDTMTAIFSEQ